MKRNLRPGLRVLGLLDAEHQNDDRKHRRYDGKPQHGADVIVEEIHQRDGRCGTERGADRIERLAKPERLAALLCRRKVGHQRISRRASDPFADAVEKARDEHKSNRVGERE
jgi:hypothetical protein